MAPQLSSGTSLTYRASTGEVSTNSCTRLLSSAMSVSTVVKAASSRVVFETWTRKFLMDWPPVPSAFTMRTALTVWLRPPGRATVMNWPVVAPVALAQRLETLSSIAFCGTKLVLFWLEKAAMFAPSKNEPMLLSQVAALRSTPGTVNSATGGSFTGRTVMSTRTATEFAKPSLARNVKLSGPE